MTRISLIAPMYNEEDCAELFITEFSNFAYENIKYEFELIVVDDGSTDSTKDLLINQADRVNEISINIITHKKNSGLEAAIRTGLENATGDIVCTMDGDLQDPFSPILGAIRLIVDGIGVVHMSREIRIGDSGFKRITASILYGIISLVSKGVIPPRDMANYKIMSAEVCKKLQSNNLNVYRVDVWYVNGVNHKIINYSRVARTAGETKYGIYGMIKYAFRTVVAVLQRRFLVG